MIPVIKNGSGYKVGVKHMPLHPPAEVEQCLAMYRAEALHVRGEESVTSLPMELVEMSAIAGRTMVTALRDGLRLTAIVDEPPKVRIGETVYMELPTEPACWFDHDGERLH